MTDISSSLSPVDCLTVDVLTDDVSDAYVSKTLFAVSEFANVVRAGATTISGETLLCANLGYGLRLVSRAGGVKHTLLFDTGPEAAIFIRNCTNLGIALGEVECIAITHGHWDHMGALPAAIDAIVQQGGRVSVHTNPDMFNERGVRLPSGAIVPVAKVPLPVEIRQHGATVVNDPSERLLLDQHFYYSGEIPRVSAFEKGRVDHLCRKGPNAPWQPDPFLMDERMLVTHVRDLGLVVFSACSHAGIVNVCTHTRNLFPDIPIYCVMGGLHLGGVMEAIIPDTVEALRQFRIRHIISGHCTGWRALHALANAFRRQREPVGGRHELHFRCRRAAPSEAVRPAMKLVSGQPHGALPDGQDRLPVTVVTGFLGSGKTTLLNHILTSQRGLKVAVIVNEIGEIGIDGELIIATGDDMVELSNGCICCSLNNDLAGAGRRVLARREKIDHLLVETSGVADPLPIVLTFLRPEFRNRMRIDSIVSIADAESFSLDLFASRPARNQFVYADVMLLNKCDLVGADRVGSVEEQIRNVADRARIVRTTRCRVPLPLILSAGLFQSDRYLTALTDPVPDGDRHRHDEAGRPHLVDDGFESISFAADRPFAVDKFQRFLEQLPDNVFRAKGILWIDESDRRWVFHLVGKRFTLDESGAASPMRNRLVLIGRNLDRALLREELANCLI